MGVYLELTKTFEEHPPHSMALCVSLVDCLSISRIFYCTQKPVGDACMSVYHMDDTPSFWADNDVGHKLKSRGREGVADWSPPTITKESITVL
jgi:hypothetical protein